MEEKKITRQLWHEFPDGELKERGMALSAAVEEMRRVKDEQKESNAQFREELDTLGESVKALAIGIRERGEQQATDCIVHFHKPAVGRKEVYRADTGEKVAEEAMTPDECQEHLFEGAAGA